ncbi:PREDICTED: heparan-sulfate 6-O-sulfotransferase 3 [Calidris pugnax]|uniref:heparan-sulfate 6-O-sulfotransferase 3 n=1 Tax=Calidris pugnax TaxID=198806 RepID=UPI00071D848B|nr:PREDICTED: heparan-sulfate 6-O-sulfotransferase 3 [Calidris pugnax]
MDERSNRWLLPPLLALLFLLIVYQYVSPACPGAACSRRPPASAARRGEGPAEREEEEEVAGLKPQTLRDPHHTRPSPSKNKEIIRRNIRLEQPCYCRAGQKKCACHRPGGDKDTWLFSRFSTGWSCGLHADWTELTSCVPAAMERRGCAGNRTLRNFYYITMLRDPVSRYLSEWKHVQRGATWKTSLHMCDGRSPTPDELPTCYEGDDWSGVTLQEFMDCSYNLANNRQVRMLADLSLVGCYNLTFMNESERNVILLQSAKNNLKNMAFFGLTEFQRKTQYLFERTFNLKFISPFTQFNVTRASNVDIGEDVRQRIEELNFLDVQLYEYAKDLFLQRFQYSKQEEHQKNRLKRREERRLLREQRAHQWPREEAAEVTVTEDYNSQVARW